MTIKKTDWLQAMFFYCFERTHHQESLVLFPYCENSLV